MTRAKLKTPSQLDVASENRAYGDGVLAMVKELHLSGFGKRYQEVRQDPTWLQLSSERQLFDLFKCEIAKREANTVQKLYRRSNLPTELLHAVFEDINEDNGLVWDKRVLGLIRMGDWMTREGPADLIISGPCGVGKSYLAACCVNFMINHKKSAYFVRAGRLFTDLRLHRNRDTIEKRKQELKKIGLLVLDDFLIEDLSEEDCADLLDIINDRCRNRPTIFTSQFKLEGWLERLGNTPLSQAVLDRISHSAYKIHIEGPSLRLNVNQDNL